MKKNIIESQLKSLSNIGLRSLIFCERIISNEEYNEWLKLYQEASNAILDRNKKLSKVAEKIEIDLNVYIIK